MEAPRAGPKTTVHIQGPAFKHTEYAPDKHSPPSYSQRIYVFSLPEPEPIDSIVATLHDALQACVKAIPVLAGIIVNGLPGPKNTRRMLSSDEATGSLEFIKHDLRAHISYADLEHAGFPMSAFSTAELLPVPGFGALPERSPVAYVQANFVRGGLLLGLAISHYAMDGIGISALVDLLSRNYRLLEASQAPTATLSDHAFNPGGLVASAPTDDAASNGSKESLGEVIARHKAYMYVPDGNPKPPAGSVLFKKNIAKLIRIDSDAMEALVAELRKTHPRISTHDAAVALLWRTMVRANSLLGRCKTSEAEISMPLSGRRFDPLGLAPDYIGNVMYLIHTSMPIPELIAEDSLPRAATAIRKAISDVSVEQVRDFYGAVDAAGLHGWVWTVFARLTVLSYGDAAGFFMTSNYYHDTDALDFGSCLGDVKAFRLCKEGVAGVPTIMPRASRRLRRGLEISLETDQEIWDVLAGDEVWSKYAFVVDDALRSP